MKKEIGMLFIAIGISLIIPSVINLIIYHNKSHEESFSDDKDTSQHETFVLDRGSMYLKKDTVRACFLVNNKKIESVHIHYVRNDSCLIKQVDKWKIRYIETDTFVLFNIPKVDSIYCLDICCKI